MGFGRTTKGNRSITMALNDEQDVRGTVRATHDALYKKSPSVMQGVP